jgi:hypothetical protein
MLVIRLKDQERKNPAFVWQQGKNISRMTKASLSARVTWSMREYEAERTMPNAHMLIAMAKLMNRTPKELKVQWEAWIGQRPGVALDDGHRGRE